MSKLFLLFSLLPIFAFSQTDSLQKNSNGQYEISEIVNVDSSSKDDLYSRAKKFVAINFKSGKAVTQLNDDNSKTVVGKGVETMKIKISIGSPVYQPMDYTFTILCKDNRYKYVISDFLFYNTGDLNTTKALEDESYWLKNKQSKKMWLDIKHQTTKQMNSLIALLKKSMTEDNNW
ncbi:MAG: DUF4468 domain-containing protein [Ginsengibacter sp.]